MKFRAIRHIGKQQFLQMFKKTLALSGFAILLFALSLTITQTVFADGATITRDEHHIYITTPIALTYDADQQEQIRDGVEVLLNKLEIMNANNPRKTWKDTVVNQLVESSKSFEDELDELVAFTQKQYGNYAPSHEFEKNNLLPSGYILFTGVEVTAGMGLSAGGSVMLGLVFVPVRVTVLDIDTNQVLETYNKMDSTLVVWPTANIGAGVGAGTATRLGLGFIWGHLQKASDFRGLVFGASGSMALGVGANAKAALLKNWSKEGAYSNFFVTIAAEGGTEAKAELHGNLSYIIDAQVFFKATGATLDVIKNKMGLSAPVNK